MSASPPDTAPTHGVRADIQGLRAVAVLSVMLSHAAIAGFSGGFVGVDVFFVISGFLITGGLVRSVREDGRVSIIDFYARRARRILPAAAVTLIAICVGSAACYTAGDVQRVVTDAKWATFFAENINLASAGTDYFADNSFVSPVQHFWSLAVEEQFYLVWPLLIAGVTWLTVKGNRRLRARSRIAARRCAALVLVLGVLSFGWSIHTTVHSPHSAYFSTFARAWELGVGALAALLVSELGRLPRIVKAFLGWAGITAIVIAVVRYDASTPFPGYLAALPVLGSGAILVAGIDGPRWGAGTILGVAPMRFIGDISYSLYLWHWPLLVLAPAYLGHPVSLRGRAVLLVAAVLISWLSYRYVETPFRRRSWITRTSRRTLALWPVAVATVLCGAFVVEASFASVTTVAASTGTKVAGDASPQMKSAALLADVRTAARDARASKQLPTALVPPLTQLTPDVYEPKPGCSLGASGASHNLCFHGQVQSTRAIAVWGDSHAGQWMTPLTALAARNGYRIVLFDKASCNPTQVTESYHGGTYTECLTYQRWVLAQLRTLKPELLVLGGAMGLQIVDPTTGGAISGAAADAQFRTQATKTLREARSVVPRVVVLSDINLLAQDAARCLGARTADYSTCAAPQNPRIAARDALWKAAAHDAGATYVDLVPWFCQDGICPVVVGNMIVYRDSDHVTDTYATKLEPVLGQALHL